MPRSLRILHVAESLGAGVLGVLVALTQRLCEQGHQVALVHGHRPETPNDVRALLDPRVALIPLAWSRTSRVGHIRAVRAVNRIVTEWEPDLVHLHSSYAGMVGAMAIPSRVARVYSPHGFAFSRSSDTRLHRMAYLMLESCIARRVDTIGAVSASEVDQATRRLHAPRVALVENGISELDPDRLPPAVRRDRPRVVAMGRVEHQQPEVSGRILAGVSDIADVAWIGGATDDRAGLRAIAASGVAVTGWLGHEEAKDRLAQATAMLHWSAWDAQPLVVLEALARDVVVVASDISANREILGPDQVRETPEQAIELLREAILDESRRAQLIGSQRERRQRYGADRMAREWESVYLRIAAECCRANARGARSNLHPSSEYQR